MNYDKYLKVFVLSNYDRAYRLLIVVILFQLKPPDFDPKLLSTLENASKESTGGGGVEVVFGNFQKKRGIV